MASSNLKVPLLLANAYLSYKAWTPPVPRKSYENEMLKETEKARKSVNGFILLLLNVLYAGLCLVEASVTLALQHPASPVSQPILKTLLPSTLSSSQLTHLQTLETPFLLSSLLLITGSLIRLHCFAQLGKLFTFEFTIRQGHELISSGLYAYLRHPSYTGILLHYFGGLCAHTGRGSWLRETGYWRPGSWGSLVVFVLVAFYLFITTSRAGYVFPRSIDEDLAQRKEFGKKWDVYAGRVRYRIIPGVF